MVKLPFKLSLKIKNKRNKSNTVLKLLSSPSLTSTPGCQTARSCCANLLQPPRASQAWRQYSRPSQMLERRSSLQQCRGYFQKSTQTWWVWWWWTISVTLTFWMCFKRRNKYCVRPIFILSLLQVLLGTYPDERFDEPAPKQMIKDFQADLSCLSEAITKRNSELEVPYTYLNPDQIENSITI